MEETTNQSLLCGSIDPQEARMIQDLQDYFDGMFFAN